MRRLRVTACLAAAFGMLIGGSALLAPAASASTGYISVEADSATSPADNAGLLSVSIASDMPLTSMTVSIVPSGGGTALLSLPLSDFTAPASDGNGLYGAWTLSSPITTTELAQGSYGVDVTAASADASISDISAGGLTFLNEVTFPTFTSNGTTFNFDDQDVTFSGQADITEPGGTATGLGNEQLTLVGPVNPIQVTTAADGSFSVSLQAVAGTYEIEYDGDSATASGQSSPITLSITQFPATMKAALAVVHAKSGQADSVTGTLTYLDNGVTEPLTDATIGLFSDYYPGEEATATTTTNGNGQFSMPVPTDQGSTTWYLASDTDGYFTVASASLPMTVAEPNYILGFRASMNAFAIVHESGCAGTSSGTFEAQYAAKPSGPWHNLGHLTYTGENCAHGDSYGYGYSGNFGARLISAYYRVVYAASYQVQGVTSKSVRLSRLLTRITSFRVSTRSGSYGSHFTVSGRLWAENKHLRFNGYAHRKVILVYRYQGTYYRYTHEMTTNSAGDFSGRFPVYVSTPLFAQYNGDATHFASASKRINIRETRAAATAGAISAAVVRAFQLAPPLARQLQAG